MYRKIILSQLLLSVSVIRGYKINPTSVRTTPEYVGQHITQRDIEAMRSTGTGSGSDIDEPTLSSLMHIGGRFGGAHLYSAGAPQRPKRSQELPSANALAELEFLSEDELRMAEMMNEIDSNELQLFIEPQSERDLQMLHYSPMMRLMRLLKYDEGKRHSSFQPRLGRRSPMPGHDGGDDCNDMQQRSLYSSVRCVGKKDMQYTPRLGRRSP